jgi:preprotein translocase subunit SecD
VKHAGNKIAIIVNGRIMSAPVVMTAITGGRAIITMGGADPKLVVAQASDLADALRLGATAPVTRVSVPPLDVAPTSVYSDWTWWYLQGAPR